MTEQVQEQQQISAEQAIMMLKAELYDANKFGASIQQQFNAMSEALARIADAAGVSTENGTVDVDAIIDVFPSRDDECVEVAPPEEAAEREEMETHCEVLEEEED